MNTPTDRPPHPLPATRPARAGPALRRIHAEVRAHSPYFFNAGRFDSGAALAELAALLRRRAGRAPALEFDLLFGPAYKGIPLATALACEYARRGRDLPLAFNRKEAKAHGEGGMLIGAPLAGRRVLIVDDVITAGTAIREALAIIRDAGGIAAGIVIALDRQEARAARPAMRGVRPRRRWPRNTACRWSPSPAWHDLLAFAGESAELVPPPRRACWPTVRATAAAPSRLNAEGAATMPKRTIAACWPLCRRWLPRGHGAAAQKRRRQEALLLGRERPRGLRRRAAGRSGRTARAPRSVRERAAHRPGRARADRGRTRAGGIGRRTAPVDQAAADDARARRELAMVSRTRPKPTCAAPSTSAPALLDEQLKAPHARRRQPAREPGQPAAPGRRPRTGRQAGDAAPGRHASASQHAELLRQQQLPVRQQRRTRASWTHELDDDRCARYRELKKRPSRRRPHAAARTSAADSRAGMRGALTPRRADSERQHEVRLHRRAAARGMPAWMRASASVLSASKRSTSTGVVLDARTRPQPSGQSARRPSMVDRRAPSNLRLGAKRSTKACGSSPGASHLDLRRGHAVGQRVEHFARRRRPRRRGSRAGARRRRCRRRSRTSAP